MTICSERPGSGRAARCAVCDGKFGLVRHYSWRTALCSKQCVGRFRPSQLAAEGSNRFRLSSREPWEGPMTSQISQRAKQYLKTAQTLLRAAQTMTDGAIAGQLEALADDYER
jgi:hypothetical protein